MADDPIYDESVYDPPVDLRAESEQIFFSYAERDVCPCCSVSTGNHCKILDDRKCGACGFVIPLQDWHRSLEKVYREMLAKCDSNKICHETEVAAEIHAEQLQKRFGYKANVYFHQSCGSYHVGDCRNMHKRKLERR
jgi:hypothetical protein